MLLGLVILKMKLGQGYLWVPVVSRLVVILLSVQNVRVGFIVVVMCLGR